jgi:hypothetical protein
MGKNGKLIALAVIIVVIVIVMASGGIESFNYKDF